MTISQRVADVRGPFKQGKVGELVLGDWNAEDRHAINSDPQAAEVQTVTVSAATDSKDYIVVIEGVTITHTSIVGSSTTTIAAGIAAAINANATVRGLVAATAAVAVCTVTSLLPGISFTMTESDAQLSVATTTAAATALAIPFGRGVVHTGYASGDSGEPLCGLARSTLFAAQVATIVFASIVAGESADVAITYEGVTLNAQAIFNTNNNTTVGDLRTAATAIFAGLPVTVSGATDTIIITADLAGDSFICNPGYRGTLTGAATRATSVALALLGLSKYSFDVEATSVGQATASSYPANEGVASMTKGRMWVENSQTIALGEAVYMELDGTGANAGKMYNTTSATRAKVPQLEWQRGGISGDSIADVKLALRP